MENEIITINDECGNNKYKVVFTIEGKEYESRATIKGIDLLENKEICMHLTIDRDEFCEK